MKSAYYTFTTWNDGRQAAGFDGGQQAAIVRQPVQQARALGGDNVIDLAAWKAANWELWEEPEEEPAGYAAEEAEIPAPRARRNHRRVYVDPELFATLGVVGAAVALLTRVLVF